MLSLLCDGSETRFENDLHSIPALISTPSHVRNLIDLSLLRCAAFPPSNFGLYHTPRTYNRMDRIPTFLDAIPDEKLYNWSHGEHTIYEDRKLGYRLDHQGVSNLHQ